jgi:N-acyl-D-amino-acid deacylase
LKKTVFEVSYQYPEGIQYVLVNGQQAIDKGVFQNVLAGKVIRKNMN